MTVKILAFGIVKEIFGDSRTEIDVDESTVDSLKKCIEDKYPKLRKLASYMIAVNDEYAQPTQSISASDEIAIIPPVSGG